MQFLQFKKYVWEDCHSCVSMNDTMKSFACWLLLGDNTSLSHKKNMAAKSVLSIQIVPYTRILFLCVCEPIATTLRVVVLKKLTWIKMRGGSASPSKSALELHPLQEILWTDLVLGGDTPHPTNHSSVITLLLMQVRFGWVPGFAWMEHGTPDAHIANSSSGGDGKWVKGEDEQKLIEFAPWDTASCDSSEVTPTTRTRR